ncbi:MAG: V-type ATP synthase subunit F [Christensenellaceae bacterium]
MTGKGTALGNGDNVAEKTTFGRGGMTGKMAIVGDSDALWYSRRRVWRRFPPKTRKARDTLRRIAKEYQIIFLTEELARPLSEFLKRFDEEPYPVVLSIPSKNGSSGHGEELLKSAMERALGVDILFNRE